MALKRAALGLAMMAIAWFYWWTMEPTAPYNLVEKEAGSYSNLLLRGLMKGQLSLDSPADPFLATLPNPYDPLARAGHGLHDASYYQGKYYLYFGVTPILVLHLPFRLLTGHYLTDHGAILGFAVIGFLMSWALLRSVMRENFPRTPWGVQLACLLVLGLANMIPPLLRRPSIWEISIAGAYALFMVVLFAVWKALAGKPRAGLWLAGASVAMGCCIGARPTYLPAAVVLLAPLIYQAVMTGGACWRRRTWWVTWALTLGPIMAVGASLAAYNYFRFGDPFEFGQSYQLAGTEDSTLQHFSASYILFNLKVYLFSTPGLTPYFPFLTVITPPPLPPGQFGIENPYGIIPGIPWVLFGVVAAWLAATRRGRLGLWCGLALLGSGLTMGVLTLFGGAANRYQVDFTPGLVLVATVGAVWLIAEKAAMRGRWLLLGLVGLACAWSVGFNVLISLQHNRLLELNHPAVFARWAHTFNHLPHWWGRLRGHQVGPVELRVKFPANPRAKVEPLVVTGREFLSDYIYVHYLEEGVVRFGWEHTSRGSAIGARVPVDPAQEYRLVVQMGSLYPPPAHPAYDGLSSEQVDERARTVRVLLNGRTVLKVAAETYQATEWEPAIGTSRPNRPAFKDDFSGQILGWKRVPQLEREVSAHQPAKLHLLIKLPPFTVPRSEPLLSSGLSGRGDVIYIRYVDATHFQIGHDRWGYGGTISPVVEYNPDIPLDLDIACPPLQGPDAPARLTVWYNSQPLIDCAEEFHPSHPDQVLVGQNMIGASTAEAAFTGRIEVAERVEL